MAFALEAEETWWNPSHSPCPASHHRPHKPPAISWRVVRGLWSRDGHEPLFMHQLMPVPNVYLFLSVLLFGENNTVDHTPSPSTKSQPFYTPHCFSTWSSSYWISASLVVWPTVYENLNYCIFVKTVWDSIMLFLMLLQHVIKEIYKE